ncbi:hypothetical protein [Hymenobacter cavernae]|uniref:Uncharacterized protein n=1 Tax=Hymenobacter cavernae TaxID=2044852 RepID=A0ABQ1US50_9BACT|nr:hypothetical protein [Hymenobacter cavernae]GGF24859.1 hypothetical protein GCM10011383_40530 [Hymenobacter cavernae]
MPTGKMDATEYGPAEQIAEDTTLLHLKQLFTALLHPSRIPVRYHAGLLLSAVMALNLLIFNGLSTKEDLAYLTQPRTGDLYQVRTQEGNYSLLKVVAAAGNSVQLQANAYQTPSSLEVANLNKPENYGREAFDLTRYDLQIMMQKEQIVDVERPESE